LLVQFFLNQIKTRGGNLIEPSLNQDGVFGSKTQAAIQKFQETWNKTINSSKPRVAQDAIVSPARGWTYPNGKTWTILALNALVANEPNFGLDMYCRLHTHPDCPPDLRTFFESAPRRIVVPPRAARGGSTPSRQQQGSSHPPARRRHVTRPRPYNPRDPGVRWAERVLRPGRQLFTRYEYSDIMETMEGTGGLSVQERTVMLLQILELITGDGYPRHTTASELTEFLRQEAMLGRTPRPPRHALH
jgi:hypothetical protein